MHLTLALWTLCVNPESIAMENLSSVVRKLWRKELPCGKARKTRRKCWPRIHTDKTDRLFALLNMQQHFLFRPSLCSEKTKKTKGHDLKPCPIRVDPRKSVASLSPAHHPETPATSANVTDAAISAMPSPRFGECARGLPRTTGLLPPACALTHLPGRNAS